MTKQPRLVQTSPPTLDEVAAAAGVSRSTASRALNGGLRVSSDSQVAVEAAAKLLGYVPNRAARSLVTRRTDSIALVIPEPNDRVLSDPFIAATLRGISTALAQSEMQLVLVMARPNESVNRVAKYLHGGHVDGAIIVSHHRMDGSEDAVLSSGLPAVFIGRPFHGDTRLRHVDLDSVAAGHMATEHLILRGRRHIAHVAGPQDMAAGVDRATGWSQALHEANLRSDLTVFADFTVDSGYQAMERLLHQYPEIDAVFAASDLIALGVLAALKEHGRSVPGDVAVIGCDDLGAAASSSPGLSTVRNPVAKMASTAIEKLLLLLEIDGSPTAEVESIIFPPELVVRESTSDVQVN